MLSLIDLMVIKFVNSIQNSFLDTIMVFFTFLGDDGLIWIVIILTMLFFPYSRKYAFMLMITLPLVMLIGNKILKNLINRPRPFHLIPELRVLVESSGTSSFPSSHTAVAFAVLGIFIFFKLKHKKYIAVISSGIGLSRIYLNVHYFSDVIGGIILGMGTAFFIYLIFSKMGLIYAKFPKFNIKART